MTEMQQLKEITLLHSCIKKANILFIITAALNKIQSFLLLLKYFDRHIYYSG